LVTPGEILNHAYRGRKVLVTGHTGFKGSWLSLWLTQMGAKVTGYSREVPTAPNHFEALNLSVDDRRGDIADASAMRAAIDAVQPEIIFHLAAQSLVRRSYGDPLDTYRTNVLGTVSLFEAARACGSVRAIVSATTDKVYRNKEWQWGYREDDELGGADPYSASKSCVELITHSYRLSMFDPNAILVASVRAGNVIGGGDWADDRLIPDIVRAIYRGEPVEIRNPASTRPWQHVLDPLAGYLMVGAKLLEGDVSAAVAWNFGPVARSSIRVSDIIEILRGRMPQLQVRDGASAAAPHEAGLLELDSARALKLLGWRPIWEERMIEATIDWYKAYYEDGRVNSLSQLATYRTLLDENA
jgi:CDP-glucose 4,6-dehydratase